MAKATARKRPMVRSMRVAAEEEGKGKGKKSNSNGNEEGSGKEKGNGKQWCWWQTTERTTMTKMTTATKTMTRMTMLTMTTKTMIMTTTKMMAITNEVEDGMGGGSRRLCWRWCYQLQELVQMLLTATKCVISAVLFVVVDCFNQSVTTGDNG
jgi:hypothetical protein